MEEFQISRRSFHVGEKAIVENEVEALFIEVESEFLVGGVTHDASQDERSGLLLSVGVGKAVENCVGDFLADSEPQTFGPAFELFAFEVLVHVLRNDSLEYSGGHSLVEDVVIKLCVKDGFDVSEPLHEVVLDFEVLGQLNMHCGVKSLQDD